MEASPRTLIASPDTSCHIRCLGQASFAKKIAHSFSVLSPDYIYLHFTAKASQVIFYLVFIILFLKGYEVNFFNTDKISTEQNIVWAGVTGAAKLFIAVNISYQSWIE